MKLAAVTLARAIAFVETSDLNPNGRVFYPDFVRELVARYQFQKFPTQIEDFDEQKGVEFFQGKAGDSVIEKLVIYNTGLLVDTRTNTKTSKSLIEESLMWAKSKFGLCYEPQMIRRMAYVSQVTFHSDMVLNSLNPALAKLADRVSSAVSEIQGETFDYQTSSVAIHHDPLKRKYPVAGFTIHPRADAPFSERKYFSEAPLPTDLHLELLRQFEADITG
jgi:hypothetical protein